MEQAAKKRAQDFLAEKSEKLTALSDKIWDLAEPLYEEYESAEALCIALEEEGFAVERGVAGIPTAFIARYGSGHPCIAVLGEYDALAGMSQAADIAERRPLVMDAPGHGCGHNLLATAPMGAVLIAKHYMEESGVPGTIAYYGCPAEEGGAGKTFMVREGVFEGVDLAVTYHPQSANFVRTGSTSASTVTEYSFHGVQSHPAAAPQLGRSAYDALELFNIGINFLREHIPQGTFIHYSVTNAGVKAPNVIPDFAQGTYVTRAGSLAEALELSRRVELCAVGAATMTETRMEKRLVKAGNNMIPNTAIEKVLYQNFAAVPLPVYTEEELAYGRALCATMENPEQVDDFVSTLAPEWKRLVNAYQAEHPDMPFNNFLLPHVTNELVCPGASDVGDVSWICPVSQIMTAYAPKKFPAHSWQFVAIGRSTIAHKAMLLAAKVLGGAVIDFLADPALVRAAREEHAQRRAGRPYICPVPPETKPPLRERKK